MAPTADKAIKRTSLTRNARRQLEKDIIASLVKAGLDPFKPSSKRKKQHVDDGYGPDISGRWIFPRVGLSKAARTALQVVVAARGQKTSNLRLVTLRLSPNRPKPTELDGHLETLSQKINTHFPYMQRMGWMSPVVSVLNIRLDDDGQLDPHLHAVWHIAPDKIEYLGEYLGSRFAGGAWIDDKPVRSLLHAVFYIVSGMLDYLAVRNWPEEVLRAIWELSPRRMIRPAGWYADYLKRSNKAAAKGTAKQARRKDRRQRPQNAPMTQGGTKDVSSPTEHQTPPPEAIFEPSGAEHLAGIVLVVDGRAGRSKHRSRSIDSTVRPAAPEPGAPNSSPFDPTAAPTIDEAWIVIRLLETMAKRDREGFDDFCRRLSVKPLHVRKAISRVEAYVEANLFFPGEHWSPTPAGLAFLKKGLPLWQEVDSLAVELARDSMWQRNPNRHDIETRFPVPDDSAD